MSHDGDAADAALLAHGEHARLLAKYEPVILGRCVARLHGHPDAEDVAQDVKVRLWKELSAGKAYGVPYRVVVHKVIGWTRSARKSSSARRRSGSTGSTASIASGGSTSASISRQRRSTSRAPASRRIGSSPGRSATSG
jgi:DNA-directed RNA polymerase specialized sigma24 family protein